MSHKFRAILAVAFCIVTLPYMAHAQDVPASGASAAFKGFQLGIGAGYVQPHIHYNDNQGANNEYNYDKNALVPYIEASYNFVLNDKWLLGAGATYDLEQTYMGRGNGSSGLTKGSFKQHFSVFLKPTYALDDDTAIYGKLAYHSTNINVKPVQGLNWITDLMRVHGYGVGAGIQQKLTDNIYLQLEGEWTDYVNNKEKVGALIWEYDAQAFTTKASVGFRF